VCCCKVDSAARQYLRSEYVRQVSAAIHPQLLYPCCDVTEVLCDLISIQRTTAVATEAASATHTRTHHIYIEHHNLWGDK